MAFQTKVLLTIESHWNATTVNFSDDSDDDGDGVNDELDDDGKGETPTKTKGKGSSGSGPWGTLVFGYYFGLTQYILKTA